MRGPAGWAACLGGLPAMAEVVGRRRAGQDAACRATQPPSAPHPQQPPPKDSSLSWQEAKGGLQSRGQEGWDLGDTHGIAREASPRLHLCPLPWTHCSLHQWVPPLCWLQHPGVAVSLQLTSSSTGGGRRTGWAVWEGHFSSVCQLPVSKLPL